MLLKGSISSPKEANRKCSRMTSLMGEYVSWCESILSMTRFMMARFARVCHSLHDTLSRFRGSERLALIWPNEINDGSDSTLDKLSPKTIVKKELAVSCWLWFFTIITRQPTPSTLLPAEKAQSFVFAWISTSLFSKSACWARPVFCFTFPGLCHAGACANPDLLCVYVAIVDHDTFHTKIVLAHAPMAEGGECIQERGHITSNSCCHISQSQGWSRDVFWYMINDTGTVFVLSPARPVGSPRQEPGVVVCKELVKKCQKSNDPMPQKDWNASRAMLWPKPPWLNSQIIYKQSESSHKLKQVAVWTYFLFWAVVFSFLRESSSTFVLMYLSSDIQVASFMCAMCGQWKWKLAGYQKSKCHESVWQLIRTRIKIYDMIWFDMI